MKISGLPIDPHILDKAHLSDVEPYFEYVQGKKTNRQIGYRYRVLVKMDNGKMETISIKIPGQQQIDVADDTFCRVKFEELQIRIYVIDGVPRVSAIAKKIQKVNADK